MRYLGQALAYWPAFFLAALWLVAGLVGLWYARSTRRPIFLWSGLAALLLAAERLLSPARFLFHYLSTHAFYGGGNVAAIRIEFLFGAYKYEWLVDGLAVLSLLLGLILEVRRARRRAIRNTASQAAGQAAMGEPAAAFPASESGFAQPHPDDQPTLYQRPPTGPGVSH